MQTSELPAARILVYGVALERVTSEIGHLGGYDLTISTTASALGLDVKTTVLGHPSTDTAISHLVRAPGVASCTTELAPPGGLSSRLARGARLLEHFACVRDAVEALTASADVRLELDDHALSTPLLYLPTD